MSLLTPDLHERLLFNGRLGDIDHAPVVKFFNPLGEGVWLATELDADGDTLFGLADLGEPELGFFSLSEMQSLTLRFGMGIERDILFEGMFRSRFGPKQHGKPAAYGRRSECSSPAST